MNDFLKQAHDAGVQDALEHFGLVKEAGIGSMISRNPALAGAGIGAASGALAGGEDNRLLGALAGGALGAGAGKWGKGFMSKGIQQAEHDRTFMGPLTANRQAVADTFADATKGMSPTEQGRLWDQVRATGAVGAAGAAGLGGGLAMNAAGFGDQPQHAWYDPRGWGG